MEYIYEDIRQLNKYKITSDDDIQMSLRGRVDTIRKQKHMCFIIIRYQLTTVQVVAFKKSLDEKVFNDLCSLPLETMIQFSGTLKPAKVKNATIKNMEIELHDFNIISIAKKLPLLVKDANDFGESYRSNVNQSNRLDNRWIDLRAPVNLAIFKVRSHIMNEFRNYLINGEFMEINTPKTIGVASESGSEVFELNYFGEKAYLAQSPQLYKQMAINSDFDRVFEIGPVFRAEQSFSNRHLCEFTGMDIEMTIDNSMSLIKFVWGMLRYMIDSVKENRKEELSIINEKLPFEELEIPQNPIIINHKAAVDILYDWGIKQNIDEDLNHENEAMLGEIIKKQYYSDLFVLNKYPKGIRPFYTKINEEDPNYTDSFDIILRGKEISSGAQRETDYDTLLQNVKDNNIDPESMKYYLESFSHGSMPHGGCGFGLERLTAYILGLNSVKMASFCPRDPKRIVP